MKHMQEYLASSVLSLLPFRHTGKVKNKSRLCRILYAFSHLVSKRTATAWQLHGVKEKMSTTTPKSPQTKDKPMRQWFGGMRQKGY